LTILYGTGAALAEWNAPVIYMEVPKNEIQYRMRAGSITNLGCEEALGASEMYKRFYFVDWILLNEHKKNILHKISIVADTQWGGSLNWIFSESLKEGLSQISRNTFRVRPWFEPGAWGGQWLKDHLSGINKEEINYAWSFEMIVPENGLVFESSGYLLEVAFDFLMFTNNEAVLGKHAAIFGDEFPIRFDFLDTWEGGNLSIQCHPSLSYIRKEFGENITQDETYYILDSKDDAKVYLGFQDDISPQTFREELEASKENNQEIEMDRYVQSYKAQKHELYLIPNGTIHSAGANNLVLEISATPYIFTFKMYDWLRMDLNGEPRAINIEHAFNNLRFERKGKRVDEELISKQTVLQEGTDFKLVHLPTHKEHFYDVHRLEFNSEITVETDDACHVLMLVEGTSVLVKTAEGTTQKYNYTETFVIPAAARNYTLINQGKSVAKVIKAFIKNDFKKFEDED
jgi:mannose-6-phosphate isomerase class I